MCSRATTLVAVATYNELDNLPTLVAEIFRHAPDVDLLVVDDNSPDGSGRWVDEQASRDGRIHCLHRPGKLGLGTATLDALKFAVAHGYTYVVNMDADLSHSPEYIPQLRAAVDAAADQPADVAIGSRYVPGGRVEGWPLRRRLMSRAVNAYARVLLGLKVRDCSGSFRCYCVDVLARLDFDSIRSRGYSVYEELLWHLRRAGARFVDVPFSFFDRRPGQSKINLREAAATVGILFRLGLKNWLGW